MPTVNLESEIFQQALIIAALQQVYSVLLNAHTHTSGEEKAREDLIAVFREYMNLERATLRTFVAEAIAEKGSENDIPF